MENSSNFLSGKTVLVTGSSRGIGRHIALSFAFSGSNVVINYNKSPKEANAVVAEIRKSGSGGIAVECDISKYDEVRKMFEKIVKEFGKLDILVNNAGIHSDALVRNMPVDKWREVMSVNIDGLFYCTKLGIKLMMKGGFGRIINITSVVGEEGGFGVSNYSSSKSAIIGFTKSVAREVADKNITSNTVSLGFIEEGMLLRLPVKLQGKIMEKIPMGRWGNVDEVTSTVKFLASEDSSYITGQVIRVNGGYYM